MTTLTLGRFRLVLPTSQRQFSTDALVVQRHGRRADHKPSWRCKDSSGKQESTTTSLRGQLEIARQEAAAANQLRAEVEARAAAMANFQAQLQHVETLRAEELKTSMSRFKELEDALAEAERTVDVETSRVAALEARIEGLESDLEAASNAAVVLREALHGAQRAEREAHDAALKAQDEAQAVQAAAASEMAACEDLIRQAEDLAKAVEERLVAQASSPHLTVTHGTSHGTSVLSEADAEALLDELELLRGELAAELEAAEAAVVRLEAAEAEAAALREQLAAVAAAGEDGAAAMGGFSQTVVGEMAAAKAAAAAARAEADGLRARMAVLEEQLEAAWEKRLSPSGVRLGLGGPLEAALARVRELELEAAAREAVLAEGRSYLATLLEEQQVVDEVEEDEKGASKNGMSGGDSKRRLSSSSS